MRKIRLKIDDLVVETMDTEAAPRRGGTVRGMVTGEVEYCFPSGIEGCDSRHDATCEFYGSCDVRAECDATVVENTCPFVNNC